jgi:hypothetical protein
MPSPRSPGDLRAAATSRSRAAGRGDQLGPGAALLVEIAIDPLRTRRHVMVGAGIAVVLGGVATVGFPISHDRAAQAAAMPKCTGIATRLAGVWDAATVADEHFLPMAEPS